MEQFRVRIGKRLRFLVAMALLAALCAAAALAISFGLFKPHNSSDFWMGFVQGASMGLLLVMLVGLLVAIARCAGALRNDEKLRRLYIRKSDERLRMIEEKAGGKPLLFNIGMVALAGVCASFFSTQVALTLHITWMAMTLLMAAVRAACKRRYSA